VFKLQSLEHDIWMLVCSTEEHQTIECFNIHDCLTNIHAVKEVQALAALCCKKKIVDSIWGTFARKFITRNVSF
jgi:hypothetical protein